MSDGRNFAQWQPDALVNERIQRQEGIQSNWQYRQYLQKNVKPNPNEGTTGGTVDKTMPIHASNIAHIDANGKPSRVGIKLVDGKKVRYLKTTGAVLSA